MVDYLKQTSLNSDIIAISKEQENTKYVRIIKKLSNKLRNSLKESKEVQTVLD